MGSKRLLKYDIAISFAEEDAEIAKALKKALKRKGIRTYFYKDINQLGLDLEKVINKVYGRLANYGLVILSHDYSEKKWTSREWLILQEAKKRRKVKEIFIVKIDREATLPGLKRSKIHEKWQDNPKAIAKKIRAQMDYPSLRYLLYYFIGAMLIFCVAFFGFWYIIMYN